MLAADRVDSTTGLQMAYLKQWAPRAHQDLELRRPDLLPGRGHTVAGDAMTTVDELPRGGPGLPRPAVQPAPLLHQLPHLGDAGPLGRPRALRRRVQADRQPGRRHQERLQRQARDAGRAGERDPARAGRGRGRVLQRRVLGHPGADDPLAARGRTRGRPGARLRQQAVRRRADRHLQPVRREGRPGLAPPQRRATSSSPARRDKVEAARGQSSSQNGPSRSAGRPGSGRP